MAKLTIADARARYSVAAVVQHLLPDARLVGREWTARNPTRDDQTPGSFSINAESGRFADFAAGPDARGSDVVGLWQYVRGHGSATAALAEMDRELSHAPPRSEQPVGEAPAAPMQWICPVPDDAPRPNRMPHASLREPDIAYRYASADGRTMLYVCRWHATDARPKVIRPYSLYRCEDGHMRWVWQSPPNDTPKPLYGLDRLAQHPDAPVVVVEGEKACEAGQIMAGEHLVVVSWLGGAASARKVDISPLKGRRVLLIPDCDAQPNKAPAEQPGWIAMREIGDKLIAIGAKVSILPYQIGEQEPGWDLADAEGWGWPELRAHIARATPMAAVYEAPPAEAVARTRPLYQPIPLQDFPLVDFATSKAVDCWQNVERMNTAYGIGCAYDQMRKQPVITWPDGEHAAALDEFISLASVNKLSKTTIPNHLNVLCMRHTYHPAKRWIESQAWDGVSRTDAFFGTIHTTDMEFSSMLIKRWCMSALALLFRERNGPRGDPPAAHGVLTLIGSQGGGKTSWIQSLAPAGMVQTGAMLHVGNKDSELGCLGSWITELGEVGSSMRKSDGDALKAFITRSQDTIRMPYGRTFEQMPRMTVFASSVNDEQYLSDDTGNRRWWSLGCRRIDYDHDLPMQQVWAELLVLYRGGEQWHLADRERQIVDARNVDHSIPSAIGELIASGLAWESHRNTWVWRTPADVLRQLGRAACSQWDARVAARALESIHSQEPGMVRKSGNARMFRVPSETR